MTADTPHTHWSSRGSGGGSVFAMMDEAGSLPVCSEGDDIPRQFWPRILAHHFLLHLDDETCARKSMQASFTEAAGNI